MLVYQQCLRMWPDPVLIQFKVVNPDTTLETEWYATYNTLPSHIFKPKDRFGVSPQYSLLESREAIDFMTIYIMERKHQPVFILEIKPHPNLVNISRRMGEHVQSCQCFEKLRCVIVIPRLHVMSAMGTTFALYKLDKPSKCMTPAEISSTDEQLIQDTVPQSWWKYNILEPARIAKLLKISEDVKVMCLNI